MATGMTRITALCMEVAHIKRGGLHQAEDEQIVFVFPTCKGTFGRFKIG